MISALIAQETCPCIAHVALLGNKSDSTLGLVGAISQNFILMMNWPPTSCAYKKPTLIELKIEQLKFSFLLTYWPTSEIHSAIHVKNSLKIVQGLPTQTGHF